ncbi:MAG TPA: glycine reductase, partial [Firmicutes bacterium]|nr:glycine reductase [Bacillota bacterium]
VKASAYALVHAPNILLEHGTTQSMEIARNPESEYLKKLPEHLRTFEQVVAYPPNQAYIGALRPHELAEIPQPWYEVADEDASRFGPYGEIMPEAEFFALMKIVDSFDLVKLEKGFVSEIKEKLAEHPLIDENDLARIGDGVELEAVEKMLTANAAAMRLGDRLVGAVARAHDTDLALTAEVMYGNLASKASATLVLRHLIKKSGIDPLDVDYIVECSEEAAGDMNQRGGNNFAKAIAEMCGLKNATGSDVRSFCSAPAHAMVYASSLVKSGIFKNVIVVAGGSTAKLGMNGKDHVKKGMPVVEDMLGAFAALISENDGVNPIIRTDVVGRHTVGSGASPQAVMTAIVTDPLDRAGISIKDVDYYAPELQNAEITVPAGAGNVADANFKMIAALGVRRGDLARDEIPAFVAEHGMPGYAPTQGHIPSGVPFLGAGCDMIRDGTIKNFMLIGKGSLFLGRLTNLFDGISFLVEKNPGPVAKEDGVSADEVRRLIAEAMRDLAETLVK